MTKQIASIGSISSGTLRPEDLIPAFADELEHLTDETDTDARKLIADVRERMERADYFASDDSGFDLEELTDALNMFAPDYAYFGSHPGDGADFGFWIVDDVAQCVKDDGGLIVNDTSDVPADFTGTVLHVNDHGNATLFSANRGALSEVWAIV
jgi:hypothetical protein